MPRSNISRNVKPGPSNDAADKMHAALNWSIGKFKGGTSYVRAPFYFDACWQWYQGLTQAQQDWVTYVVDAFTHWGELNAERYAARLPPAPRCPL
jgi:hypothetical protein